MFQLQSSNPALTNEQTFREFYGAMTEKSNVASLRGVVNKTTLLVGMAVVAGAGGYSLVTTFPATLMISWITAF